MPPLLDTSHHSLRLLARHVPARWDRQSPLTTRAHFSLFISLSPSSLSLFLDFSSFSLPVRHNPPTARTQHTAAKKLHAAVISRAIESSPAHIVAGRARFLANRPYERAPVSLHFSGTSEAFLFFPFLLRLPGAPGVQRQKLLPPTPPPTSAIFVACVPQYQMQRTEMGREGLQLLFVFLARLLCAALFALSALS